MLMTSQAGSWADRLATRRAALRFGLLSVASIGLAVACQSPAPANPTAAPPAAQPTAPPAAQPTSAAAATGAGAAATGAQQAAPSFPKAKINGKFTVVQSRDFHPDHNALIERKIKEFAQQQDYPLDHSYIEAYAGSGDVVQKLTAAVQAGDAPDVLIHTLRASQLHFLDIVDDVDALETDLQKQHGKAAPTFERASRLDGKWWAVPHFSRAAGYWVRQSAFKDAGINPMTDLTDFEKLRDGALKISKPDKEFWGWGLTANRSGDGDTTVRDAIFMRGGQVTDQSGEIVVLNTDPYRQYAIDGLTFLKELYTDPKYASMLPPGVGAWTDPSNNEAWLAGKVGVTSNAGTVFAKAVVDKNPVAEDTYLILQPKGTGPAARVLMGAGSAMNFFIMKGARNREAAEQLIRSLTAPATYKEMFKISTGYVYPAHEWGWTEPEITESTFAQHVTDNWRKILTDPSGWTGWADWPGPPTPQADSLENSNFWTDMFGEVLGGKSPADAVKSAHDRAVKAFKEFGAKGE
jgi:multiple sugar transport system substrate-binding protein